MNYKYVVLLLIFAVLTACRPAKETRYLNKFAEEYAAVKEQYMDKMASTSSKEQQLEYQKEKSARLEQLLTKYDKLVTSDDAELLKSKLLIELARFKEAEEKLDRLIAAKSILTDEAKPAKVLVQISQGRPRDALELFKTIENKMVPGLELSSIYLYMALYYPDSRTAEEYGRKFLKVPDSPGEFTAFKADVYRRLAAAAAERNDMAGALDMQTQAIAAAVSPDKKALLETELELLQAIGKPAPPITAETWINGNPQTLESLKGKVVVIDFWAAWCPSCRQLIPTLVKLHNEYNDQGLVILGITRLYGTYSDETGKKGVVNKAAEIELVKAFVRRFSIPFPTAVAAEGNNSETYKITALPTLVFIGKDGIVDYIQQGAGQESFIRNKIKTLMEVK